MNKPKGDDDNPTYCQKGKLTAASSAMEVPRATKEVREKVQTINLFIPPCNIGRRVKETSGSPHDTDGNISHNIIFDKVGVAKNSDSSMNQKFLLIDDDSVVNIQPCGTATENDRETPEVITSVEETPTTIEWGPRQKWPELNFLCEPRENEIVAPKDGECHPPYMPTSERPGRKTNQLQFLQRAVNYLLRMNKAILFSQPVNINESQIPHYFNHTKHPMDLRTIQLRLRNVYYWSGSECIRDLYLTVQNCIDYCKLSADTKVYPMAVEFEAAILEKLNAIPVIESEDCRVGGSGNQKSQKELPAEIEILTPIANKEPVVVEHVQNNETDEEVDILKETDIEIECIRGNSTQSFTKRQPSHMHHIPERDSSKRIIVRERTITITSNIKEFGIIKMKGVVWNISLTWLDILQLFEINADPMFLFVRGLGGRNSSITEVIGDYSRRIVKRDKGRHTKLEIHIFYQLEPEDPPASDAAPEKSSRIKKLRKHIDKDGDRRYSVPLSMIPLPTILNEPLAESSDGCYVPDHDVDESVNMKRKSEEPICDEVPVRAANNKDCDTSFGSVESSGVMKENDSVTAVVSVSNWDTNDPSRPINETLNMKRSDEPICEEVPIKTTNSEVCEASMGRDLVEGEICLETKNLEPGECSVSNSSLTSPPVLFDKIDVDEVMERVAGTVQPVYVNDEMEAGSVSHELETLDESPLQNSLANGPVSPILDSAHHCGDDEGDTSHSPPQDVPADEIPPVSLAEDGNDEYDIDPIYDIPVDPNGNRRYKCRYCPEVFPNSKLRGFCEVSCRSKFMKFPCPNCPSTFKHLSNLQRHGRISLCQRRMALLENPFMIGEHKLKQILGFKRVKGRILYEVEIEGDEQLEDSWFDEKDLAHCQPLIDTFTEKFLCPQHNKKRRRR